MRSATLLLALALERGEVQDITAGGDGIDIVGSFRQKTSIGRIADVYYSAAIQKVPL